VPVLADNTWGTPYFFRAFERGVDVSIHAGTKYIAGHSDTMIGVIATNEAHWLTVRRTVADFGGCVSPDDCWLALRGLRTIGVRMRHQMESAIAVARWLAAHPAVSRVLYPALESDPGHALWRRDFDGAASLFGVVLKPATEASVTAMVDSLQLFGIGSSWGGYESLAIRARQFSRTATAWSAEGPMLRLHVGLENPDDLIADLDQGLARLRPD
jgi:cystathionine beta-lyase